MITPMPDIVISLVAFATCNSGLFNNDGNIVKVIKMIIIVKL